MGSLTGNTAIISGSARGIGEATARRFVAEGARVVISDVLDAQGEAVAADLGDTASYVHLDVTSEDDWAHAVEMTMERFGPPDILVNNAGILVMKSIEDTSAEDFRRVVDVNEIGAFLGVRTCLGPMRAAGGGVIVNVASVDALMGLNGLSAYCSSKFGMRGVSAVAARELGRYGIRVNSVCPGAGNDEMVRPWIPADLDLSTLDVVQNSPLRRLGSIDEVVEVVLFLASDAASFCTGADFVVDGGEVSGRTLVGFPGG